MSTPLNIALLASEAVPFAKSGGLADVTGALPKALRALGHDVRVVLPKYASIDVGRFDIRPCFSPLGVWMGDREEWCAVLATERDGVPFYFIESERYFDRAGLYHDATMARYHDNGRRFAFFTRAALQLCRDMPFRPDIVHAHDWQTALAPAYLKIWHWDDPLLGAAASVLTIHNLAHQGKWPAADLDYIGLQRGNFTPDKLEDLGDINFLKGGIHFADLVTTVSPTYAAETCTPEGGSGLAAFLRARGSDYWGILNGADYDHWDPAHDPLIPVRYSRRSLAGKRQCKEALQRRLHLATDPSVPLVGVVGRLSAQKGLDLLAQTIEDIVGRMHVQFAILGSGERDLEWYFGPLPERYPGRIGSYIGYHDELAHWIEAGADFFLMPSLFEPCGLNQLYSLRYGTLPIVRATGGLNDTVVQYDERSGEGTGFKFHAATPAALADTVGWAVSTWFDRPAHLKAMRRRAMQQDFSWARSAQVYLRAYHQAMDNKRALGGA